MWVVLCLLDHVLSRAECAAVIAAAEGHAADWSTGRHAAYPTVDLDVRDIRALAGWLPAKLGKKLLRPMEAGFGLAVGAAGAGAAGAVGAAPRCRLAIDDLFVAKYEPGGQKGLGAHEDSSTWSFVIALNSGGGGGGGEAAGTSTSSSAEHAAAAAAGEFAGGGTRFELLPGRPVFRPPVGGATGFHGHNRHCGMPTTRGTRYILAGFCEVEQLRP
eukprot:SAG22_NODE_193_length_15643_cov_5.339424_7_plen_216_part_00